MNQFEPYLQWIDAQQPRMAGLVGELSRINTGTHNLPGLEKCLAVLHREFEVLHGRIRLVASRQPQSTGRMLHIVKRSEAPLRILLAIHMDTVYPDDDPFQNVAMLDENTLQGPGVADAKGGIVVMLHAVEALERTPWAGSVGWEIILNADEEIGSPGSAEFLIQAAGRNHLGLLFEPALGDGALVAGRKGSGNFTAVVSGRSAHAGRDPHLGRNAIHAMAEWIMAVAALDGVEPGVTSHVGKVEGGMAANVVPDRASCLFNIRVACAAQQRMIETRLEELAGQFNRRDGIKLELAGSFTAPPRPMDAKMKKLLDHVAACGEELGLKIRWRDSGGVCDGNRLAAAGLTNVDTLGVRGGALHSPQEFLLLDSLAERAKLSALLLMKLAGGQMVWSRQ